MGDNYHHGGTSFSSDSEPGKLAPLSLAVLDDDWKR
jgi:hypothetical protein